MAILHSLALVSPVSQLSKQPRSGTTPRHQIHHHHRIQSSFHGQSLNLHSPIQPASTFTIHKPRPITSSSSLVKPRIQFIEGTDELTIPDVRLTRSKDGSNGVAIFTFDQPSVFDDSGEFGEITGLYMIDEEGVMSSNNVNAKFVNGKPSAVEARYIMRTPKDWDRFMRFMERYSDQNGLQFVKK